MKQLLARRSCGNVQRNRFLVRARASLCAFARSAKSVGALFNCPEDPILTSIDTLSAARMVLAAGLTFCLACQSPRSPLTTVIRRVDASYFSASPARRRPPVVLIGNEAREVVVERARIPIVEPRLCPETGETHVIVSLPEAAADLPASSFSLKVLHLTGDTDRGELLREVAGANWIELQDGWALDRDPTDPRAAVLQLPSTKPGSRTLFSLDAYGPLPSVLESRPFPVPRGAWLEFGYAVIGAGPTSPKRTVEFTATLLCNSRPEAVLFTRTLRLTAPTAQGWHDAASPPIETRGSCRLRLSVAGIPERTASAVWATPRVVIQAPPRDSLDLRNLVLISLDTLRPDHLSGYGYGRETSPAIDRLLIKRGSMFTNAITTYPMTHIAHMSLFTGLYPAAFGEHPGLLPADATVRTLPEYLSDAGFDTAAFAEGGLLSGARGFWYGFDTFTERMGTGQAKETFTDGIRYVRRHRDRRFFLFLHTYQTHTPYQPAPAYRKLFRHERDEMDRVAPIPAKHQPRADDYDREIRETDDVVGEFLVELDRLGLSQRTYVVLLSDHGEAFGEHGLLEHGRGPHEEQLRVPFVIRGPGVPAGRRITQSVSLVDTLPTILELLAVPPPTDTQGVSLHDTVLGDGQPPAARSIYFQWIGRGNPLGVRFGRWKFLRRGPSRSATLIDLENDPGEQGAVTGSHQIEERGQQLLDAYATDSAQRAAALATSDAAANPLVIGERALQALRALGYVE